MRIVHVAEWNSFTGGGFTVVDNLIKTMSTNGYDADIHIVSFGDKDEILVHTNYTAHIIKSKSFPTARYWYQPQKLKSKIKEIKPDLIHLHFTYPPYSFITNLSIPTVITTHGLSSINVKGSYSKKHYLKLGFLIDPLFEKMALRNADAIIAVSKWMKQKVDDLIGVNAKTVFIPNGINCNQYAISNTKKDVVHPSIFFAGRLLKIKGADILLIALSIVKQKYPDVHLYIAGDGSQRKNLELLTLDLNIEDNVDFLNFISQEQMIQIMNSIDLFVLPSRFENASIVLLEALASGKPVVATEVGGTPHILDYGKYGILVEAENAKAMADGILKLIDNPSLSKEFGEKGKKRAQEYSWDDVSKRIISLYESLI